MHLFRFARTSRGVFACLLPVTVLALAFALAACSGPEETNDDTATASTAAVLSTVASAPAPSPDIEEEQTPATDAASIADVGNPTSTIAPPTATATATATAAPPTNTPHPTRTPRPRATATPTTRAPSPDFVDPYVATLKVLDERGIDPGMPWGEKLLESAHLYPWVYTFSTADVGSYNDDSYGFLNWLRAHVDHLMAPLNADGSSLYTTIHEPLVLQLHAAIYKPNSLVGRMVRDAEINYERSAPGLSYMALVSMLFEPAYHEQWMNPSFADATAREVQKQVEEYIRAYAFGSRYVGFADYLSSVGYEVPGYDLIGNSTPPASTPTPTRPPTGSGPSGVPSEGEVLYNRSLTEWNTGEFEAGWFAVVGSEFRIGAWEGAGREWGRTHAAWTNETGFSDISASVSVRAIAAESSGGCIAVRQDASAGEYNFCMLSNGRTWATYDAVNANGEWYQEVLLTDEVRQGSKAPDQWNRLRIVARGDQLWFIVNDVVQGSVRHGGRSAGAVAIQVTNWSADDAEWAFDNLIITAVR